MSADEQLMNGYRINISNEIKDSGSFLSSSGQLDDLKYRKLISIL